jgi:hypothetical protein
MITCALCGVQEETDYQRGGAGGLPVDWLSVVTVTRDLSTSFDSVNPYYSSTFCSSDCAVMFLSRARTLQSKQIRPPELMLRDEVEETREMQATRIGLTVLDILDTLFSQDLSSGALIPLDAEYESLPGTCLLTVALMDEVDLPPEFLIDQGDTEGLTDEAS